MLITSTDIHKISGLVFNALEHLKRIKEPKQDVKDLIKNVTVLRNDIHSMHKDYDEPRREGKEVLEQSERDVEVDDHKFGLAFNFLNESIMALRRVHTLSHELKKVHDILIVIENIMKRYHHHASHHEHAPSKPLRHGQKPVPKPRHKRSDGTPIHEHSHRK